MIREKLIGQINEEIESIDPQYADMIEVRKILDLLTTDTLRRILEDIQQMEE